jgi:hypothetical protein
MKFSPLQLNFHLGEEKEVGWSQRQPSKGNSDPLEAVVEVPCTLPSGSASVHFAVVVAEISPQSSS